VSLCAALGALAPLSPARSAVIAPPPGQEIIVTQERVLIVFDPLTGSQTVLVQHTFVGTSAPFGLIIPTPKPARAQVAPERLRVAVSKRLHPVARPRRTLEIELVSWVGACAVREVGETAAGGGGKRRLPNARGEPALIGGSPEPLHDWLLNHGFTLAPAQAAWLSDLRARGWSAVAVVVRPPSVDGPPPAELRGPVIALTHPADEPVYAAAQPPFALAGAARNNEGPPLEIAVLTEWAVDVDAPDPPAPFFAATLSSRDISRISVESGGLPWSFRRDGTLTAFELPRPPGRGIVRFVRTEPRPAVRPTPQVDLLPQKVSIPVELILVALALGVWAWLRFGRSSPSNRSGSGVGGKKRMRL